MASASARSTGTRLLNRAQAEGIARPDLRRTELFSLIAALAWLNDRPSSAPRADHLFEVIAGAILAGRDG